MGRQSTGVLFFNDTATTEIYTLSLHDALPISRGVDADLRDELVERDEVAPALGHGRPLALLHHVDELQQRDLEAVRSEAHTSELQSRQYLLCRLLLDHKNDHPPAPRIIRPSDP